eukprot:TRINITY_DN876_c1_g1_i4.p1 TRINITY_DN876_c1_g1~~TRINITY_DN876_c1_g1_i4.p1  ORF type:complete len:143 (-),score=9.34 TRINITY_DN876_c1_g1_i4:1075-1503(-)
MFFNRCWGMLELLPQPVAWKPFYENSVVAAAYSTDRGLTVAEDGHDGRIFVTSGAAPVHTLYSYVPYFKPTHRLSISADGLYVAVVCDVDDDPHMLGDAPQSTKKSDFLATSMKVALDLQGWVKFFEIPLKCSKAFEANRRG